MTGYKRNRKKRTHLSEEWRNSQLCKRQFKNNISNLRHSYIISLKDTENLEKSVYAEIFTKANGDMAAKQNCI